MTNMTKNYELTLLFPIQEKEQGEEEILAPINDVIQKNKGKLKDSVSPSNVMLGYPIKGQSRASLSVIGFSCEPENLVEIEKQLQEQKEVLRYFLAKKNPKKIFRFPVFKNKDSDKVELEDIDKKIEEIFNAPLEDSAKNSKEKPKAIEEEISEELSKGIEKKDELK